MNRTKCFAAKIGFVLGSVLLGYTACGQPSLSVGVSVPLPAVEVVIPSVEIHAESDFYQPLAPHGEWVEIGSYGRCWRPARVETGWRPYCNGSWQRTDAGWYWVSDEPWAWATYHYGRWDFTDRYGWYWVPQTQWAPAWVSWHEGGGYIGWAPLLPAVRFSASGFVGFNASLISPRAYVFVEHRRFVEPIRPTTVVVNNTTIISKTVTITNTKFVNNTVINEGPATAVIEKASGRRIQPLPVQDLRRKQEATVVSRQRLAAPVRETKQGNVQTPVFGQAQPRERKAVAATEPLQVQKPAPAAPEFKPTARLEGNNPAANKPAAPQPDKHIEKQEQPARSSARKVQRPARENPPANEKGEPDKDHGNKRKE